MEDTPKISGSAIVVRSQVEPKADYHAYQEHLRFDFYYSCCYCTIMENEAQGLGFQIDHYYPKKHFPELEKDYNNLMWSCARCNIYKSDFFPDEADRKRGHEVIRPDHEDPYDHYDLFQYRLKSKTPKGEFNVELLELNRQHLRRLREIREGLWDSGEFVAQGIQKLLRVKLDQISPRLRLKFLKIQKDAKARQGQISTRLDELIRYYARSIHLDEDPEKAKRRKKRRDFLRNQKAVMPDRLN